MAKKKLTRVFEPCMIGQVEIKNRFVHFGSHAGMPQTDKGDGDYSPRWLSFYEGLAKGGFGLVSLGGGIVSLDETGTKGTSGIWSRHSAAGRKIYADAIHKHGAKAFWQIILGYPTRLLLAPGTLSLGSSTLTKEDMDELIPWYNPTVEMTKDQIKLCIDTIVESAVLLKESGFDGIELNGGHDHGLNLFLSPAWNRRTDEYGGSPQNRARMMCELNLAIKEACGEEFAVVDNYSSGEFLYKNGRTVADSVEIAKCLEANGADCIHARFEMYHEAVPEYGQPVLSHELPDIELYPEYLDQDLSEFGIDNRFGRGIAAWSGGAAAIKAAVSIPVSTAGRMDAFVGEQLIEEGKIDLVNICRRAVADPDYCNKIIAGDYDEIRPCVGCNTCYDMSEHGVNTWCMVNPSTCTNFEYEQIGTASEKKRVLIIGSGASGLEAARVSAIRGHEVILCEKEPEIGGTLPLAGMINDFHEDFLPFSQWQQRQVKKLGVDIRTKTLVDKAYVEKVNPDVIIVAIGGAEDIPDIPGIDKKIVTTGEQLHEKLRTATKFFDVEKLGKLSNLYLPLGKKVIIIGGGAQGVQTAHFLIKRGREVVLVTDDNEIGTGMLDCGPKPYMLHWFVTNNIEVHMEVTYKEITDKGLVIVEKDGTEVLLEADDIITTLQMLPNMGLYEELKDCAPEVYAIGDCNPLIIEEEYPISKIEPVETRRAWPRYTVTGIREAYRICREL